MALTNSRPLQIPTMENELLHNSTSPIFQLNGLILNNNNRGMGNNGINNNIISSFPGSETVDLIDVNPAMNPNINLNNNGIGQNNLDDSNGKSNGNGKNKKDNSPKKENPLLEISKLIPVTGERPIPEDRSSPLDDDVLFAVFVILWENDPDQQGMTVKQLCDLLLTKHPDMSNLSTKLSNLISAKLNAYVKKIEKGEKTLKYAISREWSNSSPRRMLYIYRGILASDYKEHAVKVTNQLKQQMALENEMKNENDNINSNNFDGNNQNGSPNTINMGAINRSNIGISTNMAFSLSPGFNIPYSSSPVSATLNNTPNKSNQVKNDNIKNKNSKNKSNELMKQSDNNDNDTRKRNNSDLKTDGRSRSNNSNKSLMTPQNKRPKINGTDAGTGTSRSTTMTPSLLDGSHPNGSITSGTPASSSHTSYVTVVAAAPRISKLLPKSGMRTSISNHNLHTAGNNLISMFHKTSSTGITISDKTEDKTEEDNAWIEIVRNGFLTKDIDSPESISLEELDSII